MKNQRPAFSAIFILPVFFVMMSLSLHAIDLAIWDFEPGVNTPSVVLENVIAGPATFGSGVGSIAYYSGNGSSNAYAAAGWSTGALDPDDYLEFTIGPEAGFALNITTFGFDHRRSGTGITSWEIRSSLDGFTATVASGSVPDLTNFYTVVVPLPTDFQSITTMTTFRIYGFNAESGSGTWRFDNVYFQGSEEVLPPVPLANWAIIIGALLMITFVAVRFRK